MGSFNASMLKVLLYGIFCSTVFICTFGNMLGPGKWRVLKMEKVAGEMDEVEFNLSQRKLNRTHDCFQGSMKFNQDLGRQYGAKIDVCKFVDGGCKQYQVLSDDSFQGMVETYAEENVKGMLSSAGLDNPGWPIPAGEYVINNFMFNYDELPEEGPYGSFIAKACCMKGAEETGCISMKLEFREKDEHDDYEE